MEHSRQSSVSQERAQSARDFSRELKDIFLRMALDDSRFLPHLPHQPAQPVRPYEEIMTDIRNPEALTLEEMGEVASANLKVSYLDATVRNLYAGMVWRHTKEGYDYWSSIHNRLQEYIRIKKQYDRQLAESPSRRNI